MLDGRCPLETINIHYYLGDELELGEIQACVPPESHHADDTNYSVGHDLRQNRAFAKLCLGALLRFGKGTHIVTNVAVGNQDRRSPLKRKTSLPHGAGPPISR